MFEELKCELKFASSYLDTLKLLEKEHSMEATKEALEHAINLINLLNERIEIANSKANSAPLPEARSWQDVKLEYDAVYHLERLYNNKEGEKKDMSRYGINNNNINDDDYGKIMNLKYHKEDNFYLKLDVRKGLIKQEMCGDGITGLVCISQALRSLCNKMNVTKEDLVEIINDVFNLEGK